MAITNEQLLAQYKAENNIPLDLPLYTAGVWFNMGYKIKRGEKCKHRVALWGKGKPKTDDEGNKIEGRVFMKTSCLFEIGQVEKRTAKQGAGK